MKLPEMSFENSEVRPEEDVLDPGQFGQLQFLDSAGNLVESFARRLEDWKTKINSALLAADIQKIRELAHALKGTSSNFGAFRLMRRCGEIEKDAANKVFPESALLEEVMKEVKRTREALRKAHPGLLKSTRSCR